MSAIGHGRVVHGYWEWHDHGRLRTGALEEACEYIPVQVDQAEPGGVALTDVIHDVNVELRV